MVHATKCLFLKGISQSLLYDKNNNIICILGNMTLIWQMQYKIIILRKILILIFQTVAFLLSAYVFVFPQITVITMETGTRV